MIPSLADGPLLALETSGTLGTVAVGSPGAVRSRITLERPGGFSASLVPAVDQALRDAGVRRDELVGVVVGAGPGSFTGVRVAGATGKGIAHALGIPFWALSSLEAAALTGTEQGREPHVEELRYVLFDARDDRVYAAAYALSPRGIEERVAPCATRLADVLATAPAEPLVFAGDAALRHRGVLEAAGHTVRPSPFGVPTAESLLRLLSLRPGLDPVRGGAGWEPAYLKASNAERARVG